jgi:hypothetical protein
MSPHSQQRLHRSSKFQSDLLVEARNDLGVCMIVEA